MLFFAVNSEDEEPSDKDSPKYRSAYISPKQTDYFKEVLAANKDAKWVMVFVHQPLWNMGDTEKNGWAGVEKALDGRKYTVFCGHMHRFQKWVRQGMNYYQLATTGGGSRLRGVPYGEFDQIAWVTMKKDGPLLANVLLDGIYTEDLRRPVTDETGTRVGTIAAERSIRPPTSSDAVTRADQFQFPGEIVNSNLAHPTFLFPRVVLGLHRSLTESAFWTRTQSECDAGLITIQLILERSALATPARLHSKRIPILFPFRVLLLL